ncbi:hypothetical protein BDV93DRAFT_239979 [Ceratobasidium sp. AG-I]|nr:hypothetical protein BDV93DRAFT_239979 [Ceratobasidium sp. AG-I]
MARSIARHPLFSLPNPRTLRLSDKGSFGAHQPPVFPRQISDALPFPFLLLLSSLIWIPIVNLFLLSITTSILSLPLTPCGCRSDFPSGWARKI